jgi:hypothetical protein
MAEIMHGCKELYLAPGSADFPANGTGAYGCGYDGEGALIISDFNAVKTDKGRSISRMKNHQIKKRTHEVSQAFLAFLLTQLKANAISAAFVSSGVVTSGETNYTSTGGIFTYDHENNLGVDMELTINAKEYFLDLLFERAFSNSDSDTLITAAKTNGVIKTLGLPKLNADALLTDEITPAFGDVTIANARLKNYLVSLKAVGGSKGDRNNKSANSRMHVKIEGVLSGPDPDEIIDLLAFSISPDVTIAMPVGTPYDLIFKEGCLFQVGDPVEISDKTREGKVVLEGDYDLDLLDTTTGGDITFQASINNSEVI